MSTTHVIVANDLRTGRVVYLAPGGHWQPAIQRAARFESAAELDAASAQARLASQRNLVIAPEPVALDDDTLSPQHYREKIRSSGPSCLSLPAETRRSA